MIKELIKIKENNDIVSIFCDEDDTSMFLEGYIYAIGRQDFLILFAILLFSDLFNISWLVE